MVQIVHRKTFTLETDPKRRPAYEHRVTYWIKGFVRLSCVFSLESQMLLPRGYLILFIIKFFCVKAFLAWIGEAMRNGQLKDLRKFKAFSYFTFHNYFIFHILHLINLTSYHLMIAAGNGRPEIHWEMQWRKKGTTKEET